MASLIKTDVKWGPVTWALFHTIAEKINPDQFNSIKDELISQLRLVCNNLPCNICIAHASRYWKQINLVNIKTKHDLKMILFHFHNEVNKRKNKPIYKETDLTKYENGNIHKMVLVFNHVYNEYTNNKLIMYNFHRRRVANDFIKWMYAHQSFFN